MAGPITIKRRPMAVRKKPDAAGSTDAGAPSGATEAEGISAADEETEAAPVFVSAPVPTRGGHASSTATSICAMLALVTLLVFLFIIFLQWTEMRDLNQLIPRPVQISMILPILPFARL